MNLKLGKFSYILAAIFILLFVLSILMFFLVDNTLARRVLFFPGMKSSSGETRRVPTQDSVEEDIEVFINELILGPYNINHIRALPESTRLQNVFLRDSSLLYIDFSADLILGDNGFSMNILNMTEIINKNLEYNFPFLKEIMLSVDGQILKI
jgi:hypothetical protein